MSVIDGIIPPQKFEVIRDKICEILADEIANQFILTSDSTLDLDVWKERFIPLDESELPAINVSLATGNFAGHSQGTTEGTYSYFIDVHTKAATTSDDQGDSLAMLKLQKILGICRAILEDPKYKTLGLTAPIIFFRKCETLSISDPGKQDAASAVMGRIGFSVKTTETVELITPSLIGRNETTVKLYLTDRGYFYSVYA
jgi:hypothetical protein